jgi:hypothetical protein
MALPAVVESGNLSTSLSNVASLAAHPKLVWVFNANCDGTIIYNELMTLYYITIDAVTLPCTFYVTNEHMTKPCIVGRNFTENSLINYSRIGDRLTFAYAQPSRTLVNSICRASTDIHHNAIYDLDKLLAKYNDRFSSSFATLRHVTSSLMSIPLTTDTPVTKLPYRLGESEKQIVRERIDELLEAGIIKESRSPSPILLVEKKEGENRLCGDHRHDSYKN